MKEEYLTMIDSAYRFQFMIKNEHDYVENSSIN